MVSGSPRNAAGITGVSPSAILSHALRTLEPNGQKARYGVSYVRAVCAQAGIGMDETSPDEDVLATDCTIKFAEGDVRVQVKCTSALKVTGRSASWRLDDGWVRKWEDCLLPVYFVLVMVPDDSTTWLNHRRGDTVHRAAAFWCRIKTNELGSRINIPKSQRLTAGTLERWHADLIDVFTPGGQQ